MSDFERDDFDFEITPELLANFSSEEPYSAYEADEKTIEQIREERYRRQEQRKLERKQQLRSNVMNYLMPTMALVLLVSTVFYMNSLQFGLIVSYKDEQLGVVENAAVLEEAASIIDSRIINKSLDSLEDEPQYKVAVVTNRSDFRNSTELSRQIIANDSRLEDELCGVFVDDEFIGAVSTEDDAQEILNGLLEAKKKESASLGDVEDVSFNSSVTAQVGLYAKDSVVEKSELKNRLENNVEISYVITVLQEQNVKIRYKTEYKVDETKPEGFEKVTQKGQIGEGKATNRSVYIDGEKISSEHVKVVATKKPVNEIITVSKDSKYAQSDTDKASDTDAAKAKAESKDTDNKKTDKTSDSDKAAKAADSDTARDTDTQANAEEEKKSDSPFIWPAPACGSVTGYFGYEGDHFHKGLDISGPAAEGTPVVASASGTVVDVVIDYGSEGLGCYITIDHGNGYQTTYAQCSDIYAVVGQQVEQGETIAAVGSTGDSTGPHLHFRITENGEFVDPAHFLY